MHSKTVLMASVIALASSVNAHMKMLTPIPFGNSTLNNFPLDASGSDFPCKQRAGVYEVGVAKNPPMAIGAPQTLSFLGGATHGGGSCQISLTADKNPTKDTKWQVIHSIIGDCPSNFDGNQGESASDLGATKFPYTIPVGIKPGDYVLAWTWFNRIGNREMYMNCAPVTVTVGSKKRSARTSFTKRADSFPDMFKANIANGCTTAQGGNVIFPNPGQSVAKFPTFPSIAPIGSCGTAVSASISTNGTGGADNSSSVGAPSAPAPAPAAPAPALAPAAPAPAPAAPLAPVPAPSAPAAPAPPVPAPAVPVGTAPASPAVPATPEAPPPAGVTTSKGMCTTPGQSVCSPDSKQIGTCDGTNHVTFFPVAKGTICQGGFMVMATNKRSARFVHGPARRDYPLGRW